MTVIQLPAVGQIAPAHLASGGFGSTVGQTISPEYIGAASAVSVSTGALVQNACIWIQVDIPWPRTITGVGYFVGGTSDGTNVMQGGLCDSAGNLVANNGSAPQPGTSRQHTLPFSAPYKAAAGTYFAAFATLSTTATYWAATCCLAPWRTTATFGQASSMNGTFPAGWTIPGSNVPILWLY